ncbi:MAG TPA: CoA-binding protein [Streptosporangiaceae bacterium]|jgi:predicted CoA-binding protein
MVDTDAIVESILTTYDTITVVGASGAPAKAAHSVPAHVQQLGWRIIPVNPHADEILGERVYRTLAGVPGQVGLVDVFRPSPATPDIARQAVAAGATALWLQLGIASEARAIAEDAGLLYVEDRCLIIERRRLGLDAPRLGRVSEVGRVVAWRRRRQHPSLALDGSLRTRLDALGQLIELTGEVNWEPVSSGR